MLSKQLKTFISISNTVGADVETRSLGMIVRRRRVLMVDSKHGVQFLQFEHHPIAITEAPAAHLPQYSSVGDISAGLRDRTNPASFKFLLFMQDLHGPIDQHAPPSHYPQPLPIASDHQLRWLSQLTSMHRSVSSSAKPSLHPDFSSLMLPALQRYDMPGGCSRAHQFPSTEEHLVGLHSW